MGMPVFRGRMRETMVRPAAHASGHRDRGQKHGTQEAPPGKAVTPGETRVSAMKTQILCEKLQVVDGGAPMIATWMDCFPGAIGRLEQSSGR